MSNLDIQRSIPKVAQKPSNRYQNEDIDIPDGIENISDPDDNMM
jgi:hypothetical protein